MNEEKNNFNNQFNNTNNYAQDYQSPQNNQNLGPIPPIPTPQVAPQENTQTNNPQPINYGQVTNQPVNQPEINIEQYPQQSINPQPINVLPNVTNNEQSILTDKMAQNINPEPSQISQINTLNKFESQIDPQKPMQSANPQSNLIQNSEIPTQPSNNPPKIEKHKNNNILIIISIVAIIAVLAILYVTFIYGAKTLNCTMTDNTDGMNMKTNLIINFKRNQANDLKATITVDLGEYVDYKDNLIEAYKDEFEQRDGIETNIKSDGDKVILEMTATRAGMEVSGYVENDTYDEVIKSLKEEGYTCN